MDCSVIYDIERAGYEGWWFPGFGLVVFAGAMAIYGLFGLTPEKVVPAHARQSMLAPITLSIIWSIATFILTYVDYANLRKAYEFGSYQEASGRIENYTNSGPDIQPGTVRFAVGNVTFSYSRYEASPGYHGTADSNIPLRNGVLVRIKYIGKSIVRLEVCDSQSD